MRKLIGVMMLAILICLPVVKAEALTAPFFAYDNFTLTFGTAGNPGSANSVFSSNGQILEYSNPLNIDGFFVLAGTTALGAQLVGTQYITTYGLSGSLKIYDDVVHTNLLWSGTGSVRTIINADGSTFPASYPRPPSFVGQPTNYNSIGDGSYTGAGVGAWASIEQLNIDWLGTYNWSYNNSSGGTWTPATTYQLGNAQGGMSVPEPTTLLFLGCGLLSLAGIRRKFRS